MLLRAADLIDLGACLALDADLQTDHVWQMDEREENGDCDCSGYGIVHDVLYQFIVAV